MGQLGREGWGACGEGARSSWAHGAHYLRAKKLDRRADKYRIDLKNYKMRFKFSTETDIYQKLKKKKKKFFSLSLYKL